MCSIVDSSFMEDTEHTDSAITKTICQKCKIEKPFITLRKKDVYCKECFLTNCNHKFRSTLGKNKAIKINDKILIAFNGSHGSLALLKLVRNSFQDENNPKKISYLPHVLIIDETGILNFQLDQVNSIAEKFDFPVYCVHLSKVLDMSGDKKIIGDENDSPTNDDLLHINKLLNETSDESAKMSMLKILRMKLVLKAAKDIGCTKVFTGENATSLAVTLLSGKSNFKLAYVANRLKIKDINIAMM